MSNNSNCFIVTSDSYSVLKGIETCSTTEQQQNSRRYTNVVSWVFFWADIQPASAVRCCMTLILFDTCSYNTVTSVSIHANATYVLYLLFTSFANNKLPLISSFGIVRGFLRRLIRDFEQSTDDTKFNCIIAHTQIYTVPIGCGAWYLCETDELHVLCLSKLIGFMDIKLFANRIPSSFVSWDGVASQ